MKKRAKEKTVKSSRKKAAASEPPLPSLVEAMVKLVERLEFVERKMDQVLGRVSNLPSEIRNVLAQNQRPQAAHSFQSSQPAQPSQRFDQGSAQGAPDVRRERILYQAVCADCQKNCEVPFKPAGRPIYCKECFVLRKSGHVPQDPQARPHPPSAERKAAYMPKPMEYVPLPNTVKPGSLRSEKSKQKAAKALAGKAKKKKK